MTELLTDPAEILAKHFWQLRIFPSEPLPVWDDLDPALKITKRTHAQSFIKNHIIPFEREIWEKDARERILRKLGDPSLGFHEEAFTELETIINLALNNKGD